MRRLNKLYSLPSKATIRKKHFNFIQNKTFQLSTMSLNGMIFTYWFVLFSCLLVISSDGISRAPPLVETTTGIVKGKFTPCNNQLVETYLGVPFGDPPLGDQRFRRPRPKKSWGGILETTKYPPACHQYGTGPDPWYDQYKGHSEDCLYLNIWVPSPRRPKRAVFYWIFSGGFSFGSNELPVYHGQALAAFGDIIVVSVNYRLGALGFLYSGTEDAPGNAGFYDALLGFQWVNDNIEAFGGDRNKITIGGQSAGSIMSEYFSTSTLTKGLYRSAILESGNILTPIIGDGREGNLKLGQQVADYFGCSVAGNLTTNPKEVVNCLRGVDATVLTQTVGKMKSTSVTTFTPVFGDPIVGYNPPKRVVTGDFHATDILIGSVPDEAGFMIVNMHSDDFGYFGYKNNRMNRSTAEKLLKTEAFALLSDNQEDIQKLIDYYLGKSDGSEQSIAQQVLDAYTDASILCPGMYYAEATAMKNKNAYYYIFKKRPSSYKYWAPWLGTVHFDEVQYVFGQPILNKAKYTQEEYYLSLEMMRMWTNFIKYGKPDAEWQRYDIQSRFTRIIQDSQSRTYRNGVNVENCNILRKYLIKT